MALPALLIYAITWLASKLVQIALQPKADRPQPSGLSDFEIPTADAARAIPIVFGSVKLTGPNVIWYGDLGVEPFEVGYYYNLGMALGVCMGPVDSVDGLLFDDRSAGWTLLSGDANMKTYAFDNTTLYGGNTSGGGVKGNADCFLGTDAQPPSTYLRSAVGSSWPGLPRLCYLVLHGGYKPQYGGVYLGTTSYLKPMAVLVTRCPNSLGLASNHHRIAIAGGYDANPACMIYEVLTDTTWGLGLPASSVDTDSFVAAGEALFAEGFGLAMVVEQPAEASELLREILRHIDAGLSTDPSTGKLALKLIRDDYDVGTLPVLDETCLDEVEFSRGSWSETANVAKVTYVSRADNWTTRVAQWQNQANLQTQGVQVATQVEFRGLSNQHTAGLVAARVAKVTGFPFGKLRAKANRKAWALRAADPFVLDWPPLGIAGMVCRVTRPASGTLEDGRLTIEFAEDSFSVSGTAYTDPPGSGWPDPVETPVAAAQQALLELPYQLAASGGRQVAALAARALATLTGFECWSDPAGGTAYTRTNPAGSWCPYGELVSAYAKETSALDATGFQVTNLIDVGQLESITEVALYHGYNLALIDSEIVAWQTVSGSGATRTIANVLRGVLDTVAADHASGAKVWFFGSVPVTALDPSGGYAADLTVTAKLLPFNPVETLPIASATQVSKTTASRALLPLPPGNVQVGGTTWPVSFTAGSDRTVSWAKRSRTGQAADGLIVAQNQPDYFPTEGDLTVEVRVGGVLKRTVTGLTGSNWVWTSAMQATDGATSGTSVSIRVIPVNGSLVGTYQERTFSIT